MKIINCFFLYFLIFFSINSSAQTESQNADCYKQLGKSFITDGEDHQLVIMGNRSTKLNLIFYPQFKYKIIVCDSKHFPVEMKLVDKNGNVCFSNAGNNYKNEWEFQFASILNGTIELKLMTSTVKEDDIKLIIGFKPVNSND